MKDSPDYVYLLLDGLTKNKDIRRIMLPDTLGILKPEKVKIYIAQLIKKYPQTHFDFHAHNDYGLATANSLSAANAGIKGLHVTVNSLGERAGNASICDVIVSIRDLCPGLDTGIDERHIKTLSSLVSQFSGKKAPSNKPIVGEDVFTQTAGIHADGDRKGNLYANKIDPKRFGQHREYALGKLIGMSSLDLNLQKAGIDLSEDDKRQVFKKIIELGDRKKRITVADLPYIIADVLETGKDQKIKITDLEIYVSLGSKQKAKFTLRYNGAQVYAESEGNGGYDAFMNCLKKAAPIIGITLPKLVDYEVQIPPGGKTDALVETTIVWDNGGEIFKTIGVNSAQLLAAVEATEKMLNLLNRT
ncbi:MAG: alpha-isopropylmalate synthase regulatory domain-containing protein [archaeon]|nr:alpha-isopropylmalate synthase regulatory domain-containing protein [archaeon]